MYQHLIQVYERLRVDEDLDSEEDDQEQEQTDFFVVQKCKDSSGSVPQPWKLQLPDLQQQIDSIIQPPVIKMVHVNGINTSQSLNNVFFTKDQRIVLSSSCLGVVMNPLDCSQAFFGGGPHQEISQFHTFDIISLDYSLDKQWVVTGSCGENPKIIIWDPKTLKQIKSFNQGENTGAVSIVRFSADSDYIFTVDRSKKTRLHAFQISSRKAVAAIKLSQLPLDMVVSKSNQILMGTNKGLILFEFKGTKFSRSQLNKQVATCVALSSKSEPIFGTLQGQIIKINRKKNIHNGSVTCLRTYKQTVFSSGELDNLLVRMDQDLNVLSTFHMDSCARSIDCLDIDRMAVATRNGKLIYIHGTNYKQIINSHWAGQLWGLAYNPIHKEVITAGDDNKILVFSLQKKAVVNQIIINSHPSNDEDVVSKYSPFSMNQQVRAVAYNPSNQDLSFFSLNGQLQVYQTSQVHDPKIIKKLGQSWSQIMRYNSQGTKLCIATQAGVIYIMDSEVYNLQFQLKIFQQPIKNFDWSEDGEFLRISNDLSRIKYVSLLAKEVIQLKQIGAVKWASFNKFSAESNQIWRDIIASDFVNQMSVNYSRSAIAVGTNDGCVKIYGFPARNGMFTDFKSHSEKVINLQWSSDDKYLFTVGGYDKSMVIWRVQI